MEDMDKGEVSKGFENLKFQIATDVRRLNSEFRRSGILKLGEMLK